MEIIKFKRRGIVLDLALAKKIETSKKIIELFAPVIKNTVVIKDSNLFGGTEIDS